MKGPVRSVSDLARPGALIAQITLLVACATGSSGASGHAHGPLGRRFQDPEVEAREWDDPSRAAWQKPDEVIRLMSITPGMTVVDVGAGTGYFGPWLSRAVGPEGRVLALDIEPSMIRYLRDRAAREGLANLEPRLVPLDDPVLDADSVDRVLVVNTWHHIPDRPRYTARLAQALRPGGGVYVVDFPRDGRRGPPPGHRIPPEVVVRELEAGGLQAAVLPETLPDQYVVVGRRPAGPPIP